MITCQICFKKFTRQSDWLQCIDRPEKMVLKHEYVLLRKQFGIKVRRCKRLHGYETQNDYS